MNYIILDQHNPLGKVLKGTCNGKQVEFSFSKQRWVYIDTKEIIEEAEIKNWTVDAAVLRRIH